MIYSIKNSYNNINTTDLLDYMQPLEEEILFHPKGLNLVINDRLGTNTIDYKALSEYAVNNGYDYNTAIESIKDGFGLNSLTISIDEAAIIERPILINLFEDYVVRPISTEHPIYKLCEECMLNYLATDDDRYIQYFWEAGKDIDKYNKAAIEALGNKLGQVQKDLQTWQANANSPSINPAAKNDAMKKIARLQQQAADYAAKLNARVSEYQRQKGAEALTGGNGGFWNTVSGFVQNLTQSNQQQPSPEQGTQEPGFWSQKWAAFKNWINNIFKTGNTTQQQQTQPNNTAQSTTTTTPTTAQQQQTQPNTTTQSTTTTTSATNQQQQQQTKPTSTNASYEFNTGISFNEIYRPRRIYRHRYAY